MKKFKGLLILGAFGAGVFYFRDKIAEAIEKMKGGNK